MRSLIFYKYFLAIAGCIGMAFLPACKKFVQVDPPVTSIASSAVYSNDLSAASVMTGVYEQMIGNSAGLTSGTGSIGLSMGLAADELKNYSTNTQNLIQFYTNSLSSQTDGSSNYYFWREIYTDVFTANSVLEGVSGATGMSAAMKQQLTGEAKFMRAFLYFYGTILYGDLPLATSTNYSVNNALSRSPQSKVYDLIKQDLQDAQTALPAGYLNNTGASTAYRVRPNRGAATALLARVHLYLGEWKDAEDMASQVIGNTATYQLASNLNNVFLGANDAVTNEEAIWQLQPIPTGYNTYDGLNYVLTSAPGTGSFKVALAPYFINAFEVNDKRFADWVGTFSSAGVTYYYPYKYKIGAYVSGATATEYTMVLRLAEQYLIRAEARARQGNITDAQADLDTIRSRAGLPPTTAGDQPSLIAAIQHERQVELFTEWGHRWFDLIRMKSIDTVLGSPGNISQLKGGLWNPTQALLPVPYKELLYDQNLTQNEGY